MDLPCQIPLPPTNIPEALGKVKVRRLGTGDGGQSAGDCQDRAVAAVQSLLTSLILTSTRPFLPLPIGNDSLWCGLGPFPEPLDSGLLE